MDNIENLHRTIKKLKDFIAENENDREHYEKKIKIIETEIRILQMAFVTQHENREIIEKIQKHLNIGVKTNERTTETKNRGNQEQIIGKSRDTA